MRMIRLAVVATLHAAPLAAQNAERDAVLATVQKVFDGMRTRDSALIVSVFDSSARLVGISRRGTPGISLTNPARFASAVANSKGEAWNEKMFDPEVRIDGEVAQVWGYYTFHMGSTFSHCGVDAFMLIKVGTTWRITQLADTQRKEGCTKTE